MTDSPETKVVIAYQVIAIMAETFGIYLHPDVQHVLAYLSGAREDGPLPFPKSLPLISTTQH
ncbi:MAG: hypothetical protein K2Y29_08045 [Beijerinckiaceae bacterium]|nr:hypothetical protein [Beijerinckiaceae bacterium]